MLFTVVLYVVYFVLFIIMVAGIDTSDRDDELGPTPVIVPLIAMGVFYFTNMNEVNHYIVNDLSNNIGKIVVYVLGYLILGIIWSFFKWYLFAKKAFAYNANRINTYDARDYMPKLSQYKYNVTMWVMWWVFSVIRFIVGDGIVRGIGKIVSLFQSIYDRITLSIYKDTLIKQEQERIEASQKKEQIGYSKR